MKLHEAIVALLKETGSPMSTNEIAQELNRRKTYQKRDGSPITPFQIHGRTRNYPNLFARDGVTVSLQEWERGVPSFSKVSNAIPARGPGRFHRHEWSPDTGEGKALQRYMQREGGLFIAEVPVSIPGTEEKETPLESRRIDAIRVPEENKREIRNHKSFEETAKLINGHTVELIEVKRKLNRAVIGQVVVGRDFFKHRYNHWDIEMVILTIDLKMNPSLFKWCKWNNIRVTCPYIPAKPHDSL